MRLAVGPAIRKPGGLKPLLTGLGVGSVVDQRRGRPDPTPFPAYPPSGSTVVDLISSMLSRAVTL